MSEETKNRYITSIGTALGNGVVGKSDLPAELATIDIQTKTDPNLTPAEKATLDLYLNVALHIANS